MGQRSQQRRAEETEEKRNRRLAVMAQRGQQRRAEETEEQRNSRLVIMAQRASMGAQIVPSTGRGAYCFRIHGQIYHRTSCLHPTEAGGENTNATHFNNIITHIRHVSCDLRYYSI
ncbi:hypothetical protein AVEN_184159-1 [Araneus ventricosus]|uniref:STPR domain-containing protein n=1 Tax=Araneus ventricosus TaxID=182803 RepID=A0A4Y2J0V6_ARAVE|nr:hypothetical protein AVEN_184158-1 [Araneus ventricosus]GBM83329.1 hypothetical protein AVEN_184159-1 [Araneus ventricosus]